MALSITTLGIAFSITTLSIIKLSIITLSLGVKKELSA
jgi:hypothetical protein